MEIKDIYSTVRAARQVGDLETEDKVIDHFILQVALEASRLTDCVPLNALLVNTMYSSLEYDKNVKKEIFNKEDAQTFRKALLRLAQTVSAEFKFKPSQVKAGDAIRVNDGYVYLVESINGGKVTAKRFSGTAKQWYDSVVLDMKKPKFVVGCSCPYDIMPPQTDLKHLFFYFQ